MTDIHDYISDFCGSGFEGCILSGCDDWSLAESVQLTMSHPKVYATFGCHPKTAWMYTQEYEDRVLDAISRCGQKVVVRSCIEFEHEHIINTALS